MGINKSKYLKRCIDIFISIIGIVVFVFPVIVLTIIASFSTKSFGIFTQKRIGQFGKPFRIYKIRSMKVHQSENTFTSLCDNRITPFGVFIRKYKLDELPQLFNVLMGKMSIVGPRPDVPEVINPLNSDDKEFLKLKPGLISNSTLFFIDEEKILASKPNPTVFYLSEIWPKKVKMNLDYYRNWSNLYDIKMLFLFLKILFRKLFH